MLDLYGVSNKYLNDKEGIEQFLKTLPEAINMTILAPPVVYEVKMNGEKDKGGLTGFVVLLESHISIHTFLDKGFVTADIYTYKNGLDTKLIDEMFRKLFYPRKTETYFIERGKLFDNFYKN